MHKCIFSVHHPILIYAHTAKEFKGYAMMKDETYKRKHYYKTECDFNHTCFSFSCPQANAALMFDAISVLAEAFSKMYKKKLDIFQQPSSGINGLLRTNGTRDVHCATGGDFSGSPPPFENGEKIAKFIRKVSLRLFECVLLFYSFLFVNRHAPH